MAEYLTTVTDQKLRRTLTIDSSAEDMDAPEEDSFPSFHSVLSSLPPVEMDKDSESYISATVSESDDMGPFSCFSRSYMAPFSWAALAQWDADDMDPDDYDNMVWAAEPLLQNSPPSKMTLPSRIQPPHMEKMMKMLKEVFGSLPEGHKVKIIDWIKEQVCQNYFNCTYNSKNNGSVPKPEIAGVTEHCPPKVMWLRMGVMKMMGPYLSRLQLSDVDSCPKDQLCDFFDSPEFNASFTGVVGMKPSVGRKFLQMVRECSKDKDEFLQHADRLGMLACFYSDAPPADVTLSTRLLTQLEHCNNSGSKTLKKRMVQMLISSSKDETSPELLRQLGSGVTMLSPEQLSEFPDEALKETLAKLGTKVKWKLRQAKTLAKKLLKGKTEVSGEELISLGSAVSGVSTTVLKKIKSLEVLGKESLKEVAKKMSRGQRKALLQGLRRNVKPSNLVKKVPGPLLRSLSLDLLNKANLTSLDQVAGKEWNRAQSAYLVKKLMGQKMRPKYIRKLGSAIQGLACKLIDGMANSDSKEMAKAISESQQWLSKTQVGCAARKLFASLEEKRRGYFESITEKELDEIPVLLLIHLPHWKVRDLPDTVCPAFLDKMSEADLGSLPLNSSSRAALTNRALRCLGTDVSGLSSKDVLRLGPLLCEVPPSKLRLMTPKALESSLQAIASCRQIPLRHREALVQLLNQTYGDPSDWSAETMITFGPLLVLDVAAIRSLRYKSWMREVLSDLKEELSNAPISPPPDLSALTKKLFFLTIKHSGARRKRETDENQVPSVEQIEELGEANVHWTPAQLKAMSMDTFKATVETLGDVPDFSPQQLAELSKKANKACGAVQHLNESLVARLGCVCQGFSNAELEKLPISMDNLDTVAHCGWTQLQREALWKGLVQRGQLTVESLGEAELAVLDQFICGLSANEIGQINTTAFREAVDSLGEIQCPPLMMKQFKKHAVTEFGEPGTWTEVEVCTLGNIIAGLDETELTSLKPSVFSFLSENSIPLIPPDNFVALSVSQLEALGPDNAAMVTADQRAGLREEKLASLSKAE
ncbi:otoancorin, partial [Lampris incognitus]|uniref:otoancorin n=1 Tax=Lampris incognitus TaxID=2546036 RepID=UPI0024B503AE